ncbi:MAG: hypothetical protein KDA60_07555, partial [Planctomycetales bacterium]|nr:hypothetical protein [Planctomycetales bacterium]
QARASDWDNRSRGGLCNNVGTPEAKCLAESTLGVIAKPLASVWGQTELQGYGALSVSKKASTAV